MAFISRNPKTVLNPETADGCICIEPKEAQPGLEFIGYYKNMYVDATYNNKCYVLKGMEDGKDYLFYGTKSLHDELSYYSQGDLVSIKYLGQRENKSGKFAGKFAHIWKVTGESTWIPTPEFVAQLQQEVYNRRLEVQRLLASPQNMMAQPQGIQANSQPQGFTPQQQQNRMMNQQQFQQPNYIANANTIAPAAVAPAGSFSNPNPFLNPYGSKPTDPFG